jgi:ABC-type Fe3+ transport system substrate-binding protein
LLRLPWYGTVRKAEGNSYGTLGGAPFVKANDRLVIYGSLGLRRGISDLLWAYRKANSMEEFPAYLDDHPFQVIERIKSERKNGMRSADIVLMPHYAVTSMGQKGDIERVTPSGTKDLPANMRANKDGAVPIGVTFMAMAYNTEILDSKSIPSDLCGLTSWKGKLGSQSLTASTAGNVGAWYLSYLTTTVGEDVWIQLVSSLGKSIRPVAYDCIDNLLQGLISREVSLALTVYSLAYFREKTSGSPVALVDSSRIPHMMTFTSAGLVKGSGDSRPAMKFIQFLLTPVAQEILGSIPGIAPILPGVRPSYDFEHEYGSRTSFHPVEEDFNRIEEALSQFRKAGLP